MGAEIEKGKEGKGTECDALNARRDEGRRCETDTKVDVKLREKSLRKGLKGEESVVCRIIFFRRIQIRSDKIYFPLSSSLYFNINKIINQKQKCPFSN